ncbi:hypothetical protein CBM2604_B60172 [Cupriavidus taiwanensis]|nr:hypothetical protein CBM2604_B60172 [Cupriavidus taiwanensis]SOZ48542.1 hypothetical protein CBM2610_B50171 [Cupriavidus taiwanensis]
MRGGAGQRARAARQVHRAGLPGRLAYRADAVFARPARTGGCGPEHPARAPRQPGQLSLLQPRAQPDPGHRPDPDHRAPLRQLPRAACAAGGAGTADRVPLHALLPVVAPVAPPLGRACLAARHAERGLAGTARPARHAPLAVSVSVMRSIGRGLSPLRRGIPILGPVSNDPPCAGSLREQPPCLNPSTWRRSTPWTKRPLPRPSAACSNTFRRPRQAPGRSGRSPRWRRCMAR